MTTVRWLLSALLAVLALTIISFNARVIIGRIRSEGTNTSWLPFIGGLCGAAALAVAPYGELHGYWWVPFIIDPGSLFGLLWAAWAQRRPR